MRSDGGTTPRTDRLLRNALVASHFVADAVIILFFSFGMRFIDLSFVRQSAMEMEELRVVVVLVLGSFVWQLYLFRRHKKECRKAELEEDRVTLRLRIDVDFSVLVGLPTFIGMVLVVLFGYDPLTAVLCATISPIAKLLWFLPRWRRSPIPTQMPSSTTTTVPPD